jgi:hypothetical protein
MREKITNVAGGGTHNLDYWGHPKILRRKKFLTGGAKSYVMSPVDGKNKISMEHVTCTGIIVTGIDKDTGENISFASHQDPEWVLCELKDKFTDDLRKNLAEIKSRCLPNTIDAVVIGGTHRKYQPGYEKTVAGHQAIIDYQKNYLDAIKLLEEETKEILGFKPTLVNGPKTHGSDDYLYETKERRLYFIRTYLNPAVGDFPASDIDKVKDDLQ